MTRRFSRLHTYGRPHPNTQAYKALVAELGPGRVADLLLARWLADPDADRKFERLLMDMETREAA